MDLRKLQAHWDAFGRADPLWAILTDPQKSGGKWEWEEFFRVGEREIEEILERVAALKIEIRHGQALDFGCGVGRLTQGLCRHFEQCCGVDIAPSMLRLAGEHNRHGARCRYMLNAAADLRLFAHDTFDFIYSSLVLQHMRPRYVKRYLVEFLRVLAPGGCLVFRLPAEEREQPDRARRLLGRLYWRSQDVLAVLRHRVSPRMEMYGILQPEVVKLITDHGGEVRAVHDDGSPGPAWISFLYIVTKPASVL